MRAARELDPLSLILNTLKAGFLIDRGERAEAASRLKPVFEIEPNFWVGHLTQAGLYLADETLESVRHADALADGRSQATAVLGMMLVRLGKSDEARTVLA